MKYILVIGDGMADHPLDTLGGRTPLEASKKDAIDALARHGILGSVRNVPEGFAPGSDTAIMSIFGCSPRRYFFGRAPLEAAASGIRLAPGDACYRCNMVTYADEDVPFEHKHILSHSAGSIEGRESDELVTMLFHHPDFRPLAEQAGMVIHKGSSFRHLAVQSHVDIKGIRLAPPHDHLGEEIGPILPTGCPNADVLRELMRRAFDILDQHPINVARRAAGKLPANGVWFWAEGTAAALPNFPEHYGSDGGVVSAVPLCHGIGILTGLEAVTVPTATGEWDTDYAAKVAAALADKYQSDILTDDEIHSGVINYFLVYLGTEPVGYFALDLGPAGAMCLSRLFLKEKARGKGIGRSVVAYAQKLAEGDGRSRLYLKVWARDLKAEGFAKKCRFRKAETAPMEVLPGVTLDITTWEKLWR